MVKKMNFVILIFVVTTIKQFFFFERSFIKYINRITMKPKSTFLILLSIVFGLSFYSSLALAFDFARSFSAGPIWNNDDAKTKCPNVCTSHNAKWNGQWKTVIEGQNSICQCVFSNSFDAPAGFISDNYDAERKCPRLCYRYRANWNGQWTNQNQPSVCGCIHRHRIY